MSHPVEYFAWELSGLGRQMAAVTIRATIAALVRSDRLYVAPELAMLFVPVAFAARIAGSRVVRRQCRAVDGSPVRLSEADAERLCEPTKAQPQARVTLRTGMLVTACEGPARGLAGRVVRFTDRRVLVRLDLLSAPCASLDRAHVAPIVGE